MNISVDGVNAGNIATRFDFSTVNLSGTSSEVLSITGAGNVGIGVVNPAAILDVKGAIKVDTVVATPSAGMIQWTGTDFEGYDGAAWKSLTTAVATCPTGMLTAGPSMCVDSTERAADTWFEASKTCMNLGYKLPTWGEWYSGVSVSTGADKTTDNWEWVDGGTSNTARKVGNVTVEATANDDPTNLSLIHISEPTRPY